MMSFVHKAKKAAYNAARKAAAQGEYAMSDVEIVPVPGGYEIKVMSDPVAEATFAPVDEPTPEVNDVEEPEDLTDEQRADVQASEELRDCATDPRQDAIPLGDPPVESPDEPVEGRFPPIRFPDMEPEADPAPPGDEPEPAPQDPGEPEPEVPPQIEATGTLADFARAENARRGIVPLGSTGRTFMLCVEQGFPQTSPEAWALEISRKAGMPVTIRDAVTFEYLMTMDAQNRREETKTRRPRATKSKGQPDAPKGKGITKKLAEVLENPDGHTYPELNKITGWARGPSPSTLNNIARKVGRELEVFTRDDSTEKLYRWKPLQVQTAEAAD